VHGDWELSSEVLRALLVGCVSDSPEFHRADAIEGRATRRGTSFPGYAGSSVWARIAAARSALTTSSSPLVITSKTTLNAPISNAARRKRSIAAASQAKRGSGRVANSSRKSVPDQVCPPHPRRSPVGHPGTGRRGTRFASRTGSCRVHGVPAGCARSARIRTGCAAHPQVRSGARGRRRPPGGHARWRAASGGECACGRSSASQ
jgi:hypothetical protein